MSSTSSQVAVLPGVKTFNPLNEAPSPSSPQDNHVIPQAGLKTAPEVQTLMAQPNTEPMPVINRGGYVLAVPGADGLEAPFIESVVSTRGRIATGPLVEVVSDKPSQKTKAVAEKIIVEKVVAQKVVSGKGMGPFAAAGALMLAAGVYFIGFHGDDQKNQQVASTDRAVERKVATQRAPSTSLVDHYQGRAPLGQSEGFKPTPVKVETFRISTAPTGPVDVVSTGSIRRVSITPSDKQTESGAQTVKPTLLRIPGETNSSNASSNDAAVSLIAVPRSKPNVSVDLQSSDLTTGSIGTGALASSTVGSGIIGSGTIGKELQALRDGSRKTPLTIVHIGDSHISSDSFTRGIRDGLQAAYGNAGRGAIIPANAYKYAHADGVRMKRTGTWSSASSLNVKSGPYGLSGVRVASSSPSATMTLSTTDVAFDWAEVTVLTGPKQGSVELLVGGQSKVFNAKAAATGSKVVRLAKSGRSFQVSPNGGGKTTILNWATGRETAGVRYVNFGINSATAYLPNRWNPELVANDMRHLNPDLIVWGYGTNEGFNANLNMASYRQQVQKIYTTLSTAAPKADWLFVGPPSGLTRQGKAAGYCNGYRIPANLGAVSGALKDFAAQNDRHFWDWSEAMGGPCAVNKWAKASPRLAAGDRVHLTSKGYRKSADALVAHIHTLLEKPQFVADAGSPSL